MSVKLQPGFLRGRPFGGLALLIRKSLIAQSKLIEVDGNCRCLAAMITLHNAYKLLIIDVYLPSSEASYEYHCTNVTFVLLSS